MVKRPLSNLRPFGPIFSSDNNIRDTSEVDLDEDTPQESVEPDVDFNNHADLKEHGTPKQMFISYINSSAEMVDMEPEEFAKSVQARNYARKLGIEQDVYRVRPSD